MKESRYKVVYCDDISKEQYPGFRSSESFYAIVDTLDGSVFETDRMEPEDASFCRDLSWVPELMNRNAFEISHLERRYELAQRARARNLVERAKMLAESELSERSISRRAWRRKEKWDVAYAGAISRTARLQALANRIAAKYLEGK